MNSPNTSFPTAFSSELIPLTEVDLSDQGRQALENLALKGLEVVSGIRTADVDEIRALAETKAVREYCPKDVNRFNQRWIEKGRGVFLLRVTGSEEIRGYSWSGPEKCEELPDHPNTTAFRTVAPGTGRDLTVATVEGSRALHSEEGYGLETWASNTRAVSIYSKVGARLVRARDTERNPDTGQTEPIMRPTLSPRQYDPVIAGEHYRYDTRLYMAFPTRLE